MNSGLKASAQGGVLPPLLFTQMRDQIADDQVPESAVTQHNAALDHGPLQGLADDDHLQYLLLAGRLGGQSAFGGTLQAETLTLQGSTHSTLGFINMNSPVIFGPYSANPGAAYGFAYEATESFGVFIGGGLNFSGIIDFTAPTFIYESFRGAPIITSGAVPGFAAYTVLQALPNLIAGPGFNPLNPLIVNAGPRVENPTAAVRTAGAVVALNFAPTVAASLAGATMNATTLTGFVFGPKYSTVLGSAMSFGIIRGLHLQNPAPALFAPVGGTEAMTSYIGVDCNDIPFGGNVVKVVVRSQLVAASNARFLQNLSTAESDFGLGHAHFNDNTFLKFGNTVAAADAAIWWDGVDLNLDPHFGGASAAKVVIPQGGLRVLSEVFPVSDFIRQASSTNLLLSSWRLTGQSSGDMVDGFGTALFWTIEDDAAVKNNIAFFSAERAGADNSGLYRLRVYTLGVPNQIYEASGLTFTVTARAKVQGANAIVPISPAQITGDVDDYQGQGSGTAMRGLLRVDTDADHTMTGIDATTVDFSEADDELRLVNIGSFDLALAHQDVGSVATNRFITPEGLPYVVHPQRSILLWYDGTTARWRVMATMGHLERALHLSGDQFRKGITAPTDVTIGTTPTVPALLFDLVVELASLYHSFPADLDRTQDVILRLQFSLSSVQVNLDECDFTCDYTAPTLVTAEGVAKASTQVTGQFVAVTGRLAVGDLYEMDITFPAGDATNPLVDALGIAFEIHLSNVLEVADIHLIDGDFIYTALRS